MYISFCLGLRSCSAVWTYSTPGSTRQTGASTGCRCAPSFVEGERMGKTRMKQRKGWNKGKVTLISFVLRGAFLKSQVCEWISHCCSLQSFAGRWRRTFVLRACFLNIPWKFLQFAETSCCAILIFVDNLNWKGGRHFYRSSWWLPRRCVPCCQLQKNTSGPLPQYEWLYINVIVLSRIHRRWSRFRSPKRVCHSLAWLTCLWIQYIHGSPWSSKHRLNLRHRSHRQQYAQRPGFPVSLGAWVCEGWRLVSSLKVYGSDQSLAGVLRSPLAKAFASAPFGKTWFDWYDSYVSSYTKLQAASFVHVTLCRLKNP